MRIVRLEDVAISVEEGEESVQLPATLLTSVASVYVIAPPDRRDDFCCIYGDVSVTDDLSKPAVTLFSRSRDEAQIVNLGMPNCCYLNLTHHASDRPLDGDPQNYLTFNLYEKKNIKIKDLSIDPDGEEEDQSSDKDPNGGGEDAEEEDPDQSLDHTQMVEVDELIACRQPFEGYFDQASRFEISGNYGFKFEVQHAAIYGVRVQVEVKINRDIELTEPVVAKEQVSICGLIEAYQNMGSPRDELTLTLYNASMYEPTIVRIGEPIPLDRRIVVAPVVGGLLSIALALWSGDGETIIEDELVRFAILPVYDGQVTFLTNKRRTHTKHTLDDLFSVSITFVD